MIIQIKSDWTWKHCSLTEAMNESGAETRSWTSPTLRFSSRGSGSEEKPVLYADSLEVGGLTLW